MFKVGMGSIPSIPESLSHDGKDFVSHCLEPNPEVRWTASQLTDHPFVKVRYVVVIHCGKMQYFDRINKTLIFSKHLDFCKFLTISQ